MFELLVMAVVFLVLVGLIRLAMATLGRRALGERIVAGAAGNGRELLYFWSPNCGECKVMTPMIDDLSAEGQPVRKVNVMEQPELARRCRVMVTPTLVLLDDGVVAAYRAGRVNQKVVHGWLA